MKILRIYPDNINQRFVQEAIDSLRDGKLIIYPTDTLYAIGCNALNNNAIERLCALKGINPAKQTLSIVCSDLSQASEYARIDNNAFKILRANLPGAFTFILPASTSLPKVFKGRKTVGIRIPDNNIARCLAIELGNPILTTSIKWDEADENEAIEPGEISLRYSSTVDIMINGGAGGTEPSTIVDLTDSNAPELLREGKGTLI